MFFRLASTKIGGSGNVASQTFHPRGEVAMLLCSRSCLMSTLTACGMVTEGLLGGQTGADGFTSAPVQGERKTVTVSKAGPSLGLHITDDSSGWALIEGIDPGSIAHEAPGICVGDRIVAINGTTVFGTGHRDVAAMIGRVPVGGIVVFGLIEPEREQLSSAQTLTGSD